MNWNRTALLCTGALLSTGARAQTYTSVTATPIYQFYDTLAVNTHGEYTDGYYNGSGSVGTINGVSDTQNVINDMNKIGIHIIRDGAYDNLNNQRYQYAAWLQALGKAGFQMIAQTGGGFGNPYNHTINSSSGDPVGVIGNLITTNSYIPLVGIEGPNEWSSGYTDGQNDGLSGLAAAQAFQSDLYKAVIANSALKSVPLIDLSGNQTATCVTSGPGMDVNYINAHPYPNNGTGPTIWLYGGSVSGYGGYPTGCANVQVAATEDGYASTDKANLGNASLRYASDQTDVNRREVSQDAQLKEEMTMMMEAFDHQTFMALYQLLDAYPDTNGNNEDDEYGLFNYDGSPKPVAYAMEATLSVLTDTSPISTGRNIVNYYLTNLPSYGSYAFWLASNDQNRSILIIGGDEENGNFWNPSNDTENPLPPTSTTLNTKAMHASIVAYDPIFYTVGSNGLATPQTLSSCTNCSQLTFVVGNHPDIVVLNH